ncbi:MAG: hypothetical protein H6Q37_2375 [Chloroflexi bacterium]|nr:hypothetical protein [Chloroflexota bacterium]
MVGKQGSEINSGANAPLATDLAEKFARRSSRLKRPS